MVSLFYCLMFFYSTALHLILFYSFNIYSIQLYSILHYSILFYFLVRNFTRVLLMSFYIILFAF